MLVKDNYQTNSTWGAIDKATLKYPVDVFEKEDGGIVVDIAALGLDTEDISISIENGSELIVAYKKEQIVEPGKSVYRGIKRSSFNYSWKLDSAKYDLEQIVVNLDKGLLRIEIPLSEKAQPRKLQISSKPMVKQLAVTTEETDLSDET